MNDIRVGKISKDHLSTLYGLAKNKVEPVNGVLPTRIFTVNEKVNGLNERHLAELPGSASSFKCEDIYEGCDQQTRGRLCKDLNDRIQADLQLKIGAQVLLIRNINVKSGLVNGSRGVVTGFTTIEVVKHEGWRVNMFRKFSDKIKKNVTVPIVRFINGDQVPIEYDVFEVKGLGKAKAFRAAVPLKLAWAVSCTFMKNNNTS